jgi:hypothetical protein
MYSTCAALHFTCAGFNSLFEGRYCNICLVSCTSNAAACGLSHVPPVTLPCRSGRDPGGSKHALWIFVSITTFAMVMVRVIAMVWYVRGHLCACKASKPNCELLN